VYKNVLQCILFKINLLNLYQNNSSQNKNNKKFRETVTKTASQSGNRSRLSTSTSSNTVLGKNLTEDEILGFTENSSLTKTYLLNSFNINIESENTTIISTVKSDPALSPSQSQQPLIKKAKVNNNGAIKYKKGKASKKTGFITTDLSNKTPQINKSKLFQMSLAKCAGCDMPILDQYLYNVLDRPWHQSCIQCNDCKLSLNDKCFSREGKIFCKDDFIR